VKHGTSRQQQEEKGRDITHMCDEPDIETPAKDTPPGGVVGTHSQCHLTQSSTKETLPGIITQIQDGERTQPQKLVESGREDTRKDSDGRATGDKVEEMTPDISQRRDSDPPTYGDRKKRDHIHIKHASKYRMTRDPPVTDGDPPHPPYLMNPKRLRKLKTDRDISTPRDRSRSRNRHKIQ